MTKVDPNEIIGEDLLYDLTISEKEALNGITKVFKYPRKNKNKFICVTIDHYLCILQSIKFLLLYSTSYDVLIGDPNESLIYSGL